MNEPDDKILFEHTNKSDVNAFKTLFHRYYKNLCLYATKIVNDDVAAEEIVQDLFVKLWEKRKTLEIKTSVKNYLVRSVRNQCLNFIKHNEIKTTYAKNILSDYQNNLAPEDNFIEIDLLKKIEEIRGLLLDLVY